MHNVPASQPWPFNDLPAAPRRRRRPWFEPIAIPPGADHVQVAEINRQRLHRAVAKLLGNHRRKPRDRDDLAAVATVTLGVGPPRWYPYEVGDGPRAEWDPWQGQLPPLPTPHLILATTRYRKHPWDGRIDLAARPC